MRAAGLTLMLTKNCSSVIPVSRQKHTRGTKEQPSDRN